MIPSKRPPVHPGEILQHEFLDPLGMTRLWRVALLTSEFARQFAGTGLTVNAAWPGIVDTEGMREMPGAMGILTFLMRPMMRTSEQGARTPIFVATAPELEGVTGKVFGTMFGDGKKEVTLPPGATDPALAKRLLEICEKFAGT